MVLRKWPSDFDPKDATRKILITGGVGTGKSSGPISPEALSKGGLILAAKPDSSTPKMKRHRKAKSTA